VARGEQVSAEDSAWQRKAEKPGLGQLFLADQRRRTIVAIFVPVVGLMAFTIVGAWQPLYLHNELGWTTSEYSLYTIWWGLAGTLGYYLFGWIADRRSRLSAMFAGNLLCIVTIIPWALSTEPWAIYTFGLPANVGVIGDLTDAAASRELFGKMGGVTHLVYAALQETPGLFDGWLDEANIERNALMLRNLFEPLSEVAAGLRHVSLLHGTKAYGVHHPSLGYDGLGSRCGSATPAASTGTSTSTRRATCGRSRCRAPGR
jgi:Major Facilitator Superfamily